MTDCSCGKENENTKNNRVATNCRPLRKLRSLSGYNVWHAEFLRSDGIYT